MSKFFFGPRPTFVIFYDPIDTKDNVSADLPHARLCSLGVRGYSISCYVHIRRAGAVPSHNTRRAGQLFGNLSLYS